MGEDILPAFGAELTTSIGPVVSIILFLAGAAVIFGNRRILLPTVLTTGIIIPFGQCVVVSNLTFMTLRIILILGAIRVFIENLSGSFSLSRLDKLVLAWGVSTVLFYTLLWQSPGAFVNKMGFFINCMGAYYILRSLVIDMDEVDRVYRILALISLFVAVSMVYEQITSRSMLAVLGSPEFSVVRGGKIRAMAGFAHPLLAGVFGATMLPLYVSLWGRGKANHLCSVIGILSAGVIVATSVSSTPVVSFLAGIMALLLWPLRARMKTIFWSGVIALISLHIVMKAPVWALIHRVDIVGGSTGYHRYLLVDEFINRASEWWLTGAKSTSGWGVDMWDTVNQYVSTGVNGGVVTLFLFLAIITTSYRILGGKLRELEKFPKAQFRIWALGAALFSHIVGFFGISYFDQTILIWYFLISTISMISALPVCVLADNLSCVDRPDQEGLSLGYE